MLTTKIDKSIREYVTDNYYCDPDENGKRETWEPFEDWSDEDIEDQIEVNICVLKNFIVSNEEAILEFFTWLKQVRKGDK